MESHVLPLISSRQLLDLLLQVRAQYAVVLAWCGETDAARAEMAKLQTYGVAPDRQAEMRQQTQLIEEIADGRHRLSP
jgi:hypothetical protein